MGAIRVNSGSINLQNKTVKSTQEQQSVTADEGYNGINEVTVEPFLLQNKTVKSTQEQQSVTADTGYDGIGTITVDNISLQNKTVRPTAVQQTVTADIEYDGLGAVTVEAKSSDIVLQEKTVEPAKEVQEIIPDIGYDGLSKVTIGNIPVWEPDPDWWDIRQIIRDDVQSGYRYKSIFLLNDDYNTTRLNWGFTAYKTSDGSFYPNNTTTHTWDRSQDKPWALGKTRWVIGYTNNPSNYTNYLRVSGYDILYIDLYTVDGFYYNNLSDLYKLQAVEGNYTQQSTRTTNLISYFDQDCSLVKVGFETFDTKLATTMQRMFGGCVSLRELPETFDCTNCTSTQYMFIGCYSLKKSPTFINTGNITVTAYMYSGCSSLIETQDTMNMPNNVNASYMFNECRSLKKYSTLIFSQNVIGIDGIFAYNYSAIKLPNLDFSNSTYINTVYNSAKSVVELQEEIDLSSATNNLNMFSIMTSLTKLPRIIIPSTAPTNVMINFQGSYKVYDKNSVATFEGGNIVGGMIYYLNTMDEARTLTLNGNIRNLFTPSEQTAIQTLVTSKNWTLVW